MKLGDQIIKLRKMKGLSQEKLGERIGVTRQTISNWELGETAPNPEQLKQLSKELNISIDDLLDNDINKTNTISKSSTEKLSNIILVYLKISSIICLIIIFAILFYKIIHKPKNNLVELKEIEESIYCKIYGEEHGYTVRYYENSDITISQIGDTYFLDVLNLEQYDYAHQIFNIINDYVKKNGGTCEIIRDRNLNDIVDIQIKEGTLSKTSATVVIKENIDYNISYGETFWIEKYNYQTNSFEKIKNTTGKNCAFNLPAYSVTPNNLLELKQDWSCEHGELDKGLYRLVKDVAFESDTPIDENDIFYIWVEFEIEK